MLITRLKNAKGERAIDIACNKLIYQMLMNAAEKSRDISDVNIDEDYFLGAMGVKKLEGNENVETELIKRQLEEESKGITSNVFIPKRPPMLMGYLSTHYDTKLNPRYFVLDCIKGKLSKYEYKENYPTKASKEYSLIKITNVKSLQVVSISKISIYILEFIFGSNKYKCYSYNKDNIEEWIKCIREAIVYASFINYIEEKSKNGTQKSLDTLIASLRSAILPVRELSNDSVPLMFTATTIKSSDIKNSNRNTEFFSIKKHAPEPSSLPILALTPQISCDIIPEISPTVEKSMSVFHEVKLDDAFIEEKGDAVNFKSFILLEKIGEGAFGKIFKVKKKDTNMIYAMKVLSKQFLEKQDQLKYAIVECNVLKLVNHPFIMKMHWSFQSSQYLYFILDYCSGGDLDTHLARRGLFEENETRFYIAELILAIEYLHSKHIIYRDLKPGNILLDTNGHIKLGDFGLAKENMKEGELSTTFCGSPVYLSPEVVAKKGAGKSSDIYQIGAVMYEMVVGFPPFFADNLEGVYKSIEQGILDFPDFLSENTKKVIMRMMEKDAKKRVTIEDLKLDPFFSKINWDNLYNMKMKPPFGKDEIEGNSDDESSIMNRVGDAKEFSKDVAYEITDGNKIAKFTFTKKEK